MESKDVILSGSQTPEKDNDIVKRPRGRPRGSKNKSPGFLHYNPKRWEPWMDALVLASISGAANKELAKDYQISETHVSNILNTEMAQTIRLRIRKKVLDATTDVTEKLTKLQDTAIKRMAEVLDNDTLAVNSPMSMATLAKEIFRLVKTDSPDKEKEKATSIQNTTNVQNNILVANPEYVARIQKGMELSNEIQQRRLEQGKEALKLVANDK